MGEAKCGARTNDTGTRARYLAIALGAVLIASALLINLDVQPE